MIPSLLLNLLKKNWFTLALIAVLMVAGAALGYVVAGHYYQQDVNQANGRESQMRKEFDAFKLATQTDKTTAAQQHSAELAGALAQSAQYQHEAETLSSQLLAKQSELDQARITFQRTIKNVIEKDGAAYTGIGPRSLCAYRTSLGYPGCDQRMQTAHGGDAGYPADATRTAGGLSPAGILSSASDYGTWCLTLETKLKTLKTYFKGAENKEIQ